MADSIKIENLPDSGSREAVALPLTKIILGNIATADNRTHVYAQPKVLQTCAACLRVVQGGPPPA